MAPSSDLPHPNLIWIHHADALLTIRASTPLLVATYLRYMYAYHTATTVGARPPLVLLLKLTTYSNSSMASSSRVLTHSNYSDASAGGYVLVAVGRSAAAAGGERVPAGPAARVAAARAAPRRGVRPGPGRGR